MREKNNTLNVKYAHEMRMCFGFASVDDGDRNRCGVRCRPFDYIGKKNCIN